jgi:hypothetical protein
MFQLNYTKRPVRLGALVIYLLIVEINPVNSFNTNGRPNKP